MTSNLTTPATIDSGLSVPMQTWIFQLWTLVRNLDLAAAANGNTQVDGNLTVTGTLGTGATTVSSLTVTGNATIDGNLTVDGTLAGLAQYTVMLGVLSGLLD